MTQPQKLSVGTVIASVLLSLLINFYFYTLPGRTSNDASATAQIGVLRDSMSQNNALIVQEINRFKQALDQTLLRPVNYQDQQMPLWNVLVADLVARGIVQGTLEENN